MSLARIALRRRVGRLACRPRVSLPVRVDGFLARRFWWAFGGLVFLVVVNEIWSWGPDPRAWDPLYTSAWLVLSGGLKVASALPERLERTVAQLRRSRVIEVSSEATRGFLHRLEYTAQQWARRTGVVTTLSMVGAFTIALRFRQPWFTVWAGLGGYVAGRVLGRVVLYGFLGGLLAKEGFAVTIRPGHPDGAAGFKPIGDFYFFQAAVLAIPAAFLAFWWTLIPLIHRYGRWRASYLALLMGVVALQVVAFVAPMVGFHRDMQRRRETLLVEADEIAVTVTEAYERLGDNPAAEERTMLMQQIAAATERYHLLYEIPTWPVDQPTRRRFTLRQGVLLLPAVAQALSLTGPWKALFDGLQKLGS